MKKLGEFSGIKIYSVESNEMVLDEYTGSMFAHLISTIFPMTYDAALDINESAKPAYNNGKGEICAVIIESCVPCDYCVGCVDKRQCECCDAMTYDCFKGRKLSPVA